MTLKLTDEEHRQLVIQLAEQVADRLTSHFRRLSEFAGKLIVTVEVEQVCQQAISDKLRSLRG